MIGLSAILMWASLVGLMKQVSAAIGPELGVTFIYSLSALLLLAIFKVPDLSRSLKILNIWHNSVRGL